jgi:putative inorganic carbon (hco3(-)) transporter
MSITPLVWLAMYTFALLRAWVDPMYGIFGYLLEYFQRPSLLWWGKQVPDLRWNFTIAAVATAAYLMRRSSMPAFRRETNVALVLLVMQAINTTIVSTWSVSPVLSWHWSGQYWKLVVCFMLFSGIVRNAKSLDLVILFQIVGAAYWGWEGIGHARSHARLEGIGSGDTKNANMLAAHLLTIVPLAVTFVVLKRPKWMRIAALVSLPLIVNLFILANSRGATLGLAASTLAAFVLVRNGLRRWVVLGALAGGLAFWYLADPEYLERQQTIVDADDNSAQTRVALWRGSANMVKDYPFGAGGRGFQALSPRYVPEIKDENDGEGRSSHNTYIQVAADWGIQGLALFLALIGYTFFLLHQIRRGRASPDLIYFVSLGIQVGLIGTLTAGFFTVRFYGESIYWMCALATALYRMTGGTAAADQEADGKAQPVAA